MPDGSDRRWRSSDVLTPPKPVGLAPTGGHENKLAGETGEAARGIAPTREHATEAETVRR